MAAYEGASAIGSQGLGNSCSEATTAGPDPQPTPTSSRPPGYSNYRDRFFESRPELKAERSKIYVHHTLPQQYEEIMWRSGINVHDTQYLVGVDYDTHVLINAEWREWAASLGRAPTAGEVLEEADVVKGLYGAAYR